MRPFPEEVLDKLKELTGEVLNELTAQNADAKRIHDAYMTYKNNISAWAGITEKIFYNRIKKSV